MNLTPSPVDFTSACESHDACFGVGFGMSACNFELADALSVACGSNSTCQSIAGHYASAASSSAGSAAHSTAVATEQCAAWHVAMDENNCPQNN
jgi:hypothetical protein